MAKLISNKQIKTNEKDVTQNKKDQQSKQSVVLISGSKNLM
jgi:hypothetical protein